MRKILYLIFIFTIALSCTEEAQVQPDSQYKEGILSYLKLVEQVAASSQVGMVDLLATAIDFKRVRIYDLRTTEKLIIADVKSLYDFEDADVVKAIFYLNNNEIVRSNIVTFVDKLRPADHNRVITSIVNMDKASNTYSGKISFYNMFHQISLFDVFENGRLTVNGISRSKIENINGGKTNGCTNWYLVTTYYYSDGSTETTSQYLNTTCTGCDHQTVRNGRITCGEGGGGGGDSPSFPQSPQHGQLYAYRDSEGVYTLSKFDAPSGQWWVVEKILTPVNISAHPESYPVIYNIQYPIDGQQIFEIDRLLYTYDGGTGNWVGRPDDTGLTITETTETEDPDLNSDCQSWSFTPTADGDYQVCAVSGLDFDFTTTYYDAQGNLRLEYVYYQFRTLYFEFPRIRADGSSITSGQAALLNAAAKDLAEEEIENLLGNSPPALGVIMEQTFLNELRSRLQAFGGRVATNPTYPNAPVSAYSKTAIGNGTCF